LDQEIENTEKSPYRSQYLLRTVKNKKLVLIRRVKANHGTRKEGLPL